MPDYTAYEELLSVFRLFSPIPILLEPERGYAFLGADLRRGALAEEVSALLRQRPAHAMGWVQLGWLRHPVSPEEASALIRWGLALDPRHEALARASAKLLEPSR